MKACAEDTINIVLGCPVSRDEQTSRVLRRAWSKDGMPIHCWQNGLLRCSKPQRNDLPISQWVRLSDVVAKAVFGTPIDAEVRRQITSGAEGPVQLGKPQIRFDTQLTAYLELIEKGQIPAASNLHIPEKLRRPDFRGRWLSQSGLSARDALVMVEAAITNYQEEVSAVSRLLEDFYSHVESAGTNGLVLMGSRHSTHEQIPVEYFIAARTHDLFGNNLFAFAENSEHKIDGPVFVPDDVGVWTDVCLQRQSALDLLQGWEAHQSNEPSNPFPRLPRTDAPLKQKPGPKLTIDAVRRAALIAFPETLGTCPQGMLKNDFYERVREVFLKTFRRSISRSTVQRHLRRAGGAHALDVTEMINEQV